MAASSSHPVTSPSARIRAYLAALPPATRNGLVVIRDAIRAAAPGAVEDFSYGMPVFKLDGRPLIWYAGRKQHYGLYPIGDALVRAHAADVEGYATSKGTIRFPLSEPPPLDLVTLLVRARIAELSAE